MQDMFKLRLLKFFYKLSYGLLPQYFNCYRDVIEKQPPRVLPRHIIHQPMIKRIYAECSPLFQLIKLLNNMKTDPTDVILEKIITKSESCGRLSYSVIKTYLNAYDPICQIENDRSLRLFTLSISYITHITGSPPSEILDGLRIKYPK